jgi:hypothetical protein
METKPYEYEYDKPIPWIPQQNQFYTGRDVTARTSQQFSDLQKQRLQQRGEGQKPKPAERMSKAKALALVSTLKRGLIIASLVSFGAFSGLVAYHQVGTTANQTNQAKQTSSGSSQVTPTTSSSSQDSNGFFKQQGGNNFGSSNSSQAPVSGSSVS